MSQTDTLPRATVAPPDSRGRLRRAWDTLQDTIRQPVRTVTRSAAIQTVSTGVEDVDSPDGLPDLVDLYYDTGAIRTNLNIFRDDVTAPGLRVEVDEDENADAEAVEDYFMGGENAPDGAPENGFLSEAFVNDEKRLPIDHALDLSVLDRWRRGTVLLVNTYGDRDGPDGPIISGCTFVRPETMSARTYANTNQLVVANPDDPENDAVEVTLTDFDEAAAWVQFDENAILNRIFNRTNGSRGVNFSGRTSVYLSQNDVHKLTLDQDVGGDNAEEGVFGESIIRSISTEASALNSIKRDLEKAAKDASLGFYTLEANDYVLEGAGENGENVRVSWPDEDIDAVMSEYDSLNPGEILATNAKATLNGVDAAVPDIEWLLRHYTRDVIDPLPAPFYKHSQADEINQFVTDEQQEDYQDRIAKERDVQARFYEGWVRQVCRRHPDLDPAGVSVTIEPEQDESPVLSLDADTLDNLSTFTGAMADVYGPGGAPAFVREQVLNELILMLPEDATPEGAEAGEASMEELAQAVSDGE